MRRQLDAERTARRELQRVLAAIRTDSVAAPDLAYLDALREVPVRLEEDGEANLSCAASALHRRRASVCCASAGSTLPIHRSTVRFFHRTARRGRT